VIGTATTAVPALASVTFPVTEGIAGISPTVVTAAGAVLARVVVSAVPASLTESEAETETLATFCMLASELNPVEIAWVEMLMGTELPAVTDDGALCTAFMAALVPP
jgi:hypothetical protein